MTNTETTTTTDKLLQLEWGGCVPLDAIAAWGARAIYHDSLMTRDATRRSPRKGKKPDRFVFDLLWDRMCSKGDEAPRSKLGTWLDNVGLPELRKRLNALPVYPRDATVIEFEQDGYVVKASPRASYGYLYIVAWKVTP